MLKRSSMGLRAGFVLTAVLAVSMSAEAATINFGATTFEEADGAPFLKFDGGVLSPAAPGATLDYNKQDGFGVTYANGVLPNGSNDPVKALAISFTAPTFVESFLLAGLNKGKDKGNEFAETAYFSVNGGAWQTVTATAGGNGQGHRTVELGMLVTEIAFAVDPLNRTHEYSLRSVDSRLPVEDTTPENQVPEPAALMLVGAGLLAGAARVRRWMR